MSRPNPLLNPPQRRIHSSLANLSPSPIIATKQPLDVETKQRRQSISKLHEPTAASRARKEQVESDNVTRRSASAASTRRLSIGRPDSRTSGRESLTQSRAGGLVHRQLPKLSDVFVVIRPALSHEGNPVFTLETPTKIANVDNGLTYSITHGVDLTGIYPATDAIESHLKHKIDELVSSRQGKVLLLQGPSSGGKSTFVHGGQQVGHLWLTIDSLLGIKSTLTDQLHILLSAVEVRENDDAYDLLGPVTDNRLLLKARGSGMNKSWSAEGLHEVLITDIGQVDLKSVNQRLSVGDNGVHLGSSRGFALYKITILVGSLSDHKRDGSGRVTSSTHHTAPPSFTYWIVDTPGSEPLTDNKNKPQLNIRLSNLHTALNNFRKCIDTGHGTPAGVSGSTVAKLLCRDILRGVEVFTVVCIPPTIDLVRGSTAALMFATTLQLASSVPKAIHPPPIQLPVAPQPQVLPNRSPTPAPVAAPMDTPIPVPKQNIFAVAAQSTTPVVTRPFSAQVITPTSAPGVGVVDPSLSHVVPRVDNDNDTIASQLSPQWSHIHALEGRIRLLEIEDGMKTGEIGWLKGQLEGMSIRVSRLESLARPVPPPPAFTTQASSSSMSLPRHPTNPAQNHITGQYPDSVMSANGQTLAQTAGNTLYSSPRYPVNLADITFSTITDSSFGDSARG